jgi:TetR/AcrR family fatty acid metabolism transcriptional regulator
LTTGPERREQILAAAVRVFAERGYEATRISDIATEAGVAYGLVYHYFGSRDAILDAVFRDTWGRMLAAFASAEETAGSAPERLELVIKIVLRAWRNDPDVIRLLIRQVARGPQLEAELDEIGQAYASLERIVAGGQAERTIKPGLDPRLCARMLYGALEEVLTGWVLGRLPDDAEAVAAAERELTGTVVGGFLV